MMKKGFCKTPLGTAVIEGDEGGISRVEILEEAVEITSEIPPDLTEAVKQLQEYFAGTRQSFDLKLNPSGTDFQKEVWTLLQKIPFGSSCSYMDLAKEFGNPKAIRAIATANGKNPLWILIPCHRVIGSDGSLTGYAGGLWRKKWLLEHEQPLKQQSLFN
ncbi:MAG: methylated-DNA--[protein]-cysteine S-methyltransferase [Salinimicrobium sp.]